MLDQDYACHSMSAQSQQLVGTVPGPTQGQSVTTIAPPLPAQGHRGQSLVMTTPNMPILGQGDSDHASSMIKHLKNNIRESLVGISDNLPEIKGI